VLCVICVLIAAGSGYELLLSRGKHTNNQSGDTMLPNHKEETSLGKSKFSLQLVSYRRLISYSTDTPFLFRLNSIVTFINVANPEK
jgi:hypothetical protein